MSDSPPVPPPRWRRSCPSPKHDSPAAAIHLRLWSFSAQNKNSTRNKSVARRVPQKTPRKSHFFKPPQKVIATSNACGTLGICAQKQGYQSLFVTRSVGVDSEKSRQQRPPHPHQPRHRPSALSGHREGAASRSPICSRPELIQLSSHLNFFHGTA